MSPLDLAEPVTLTIGTLSRSSLLDALRDGGVGLNASAETLLADPVFDRRKQRSLTVVGRSVGELGLVTGGVLSDIFQAAQDHGLRLCPPTTGPYLRLAFLAQPTAPDSMLSNGKAPSGSLTVASAPLRPEVEYPKGFYLRVIDGRPWLRGYRAGDDHVWDPADRLVFAVDDRNGR